MSAMWDELVLVREGFHGADRDEIAEVFAELLLAQSCNRERRRIYGRETNWCGRYKGQVYAREHFLMELCQMSREELIEFIADALLNGVQPYRKEEAT